MRILSDISRYQARKIAYYSLYAREHQERGEHVSQYGNVLTQLSVVIQLLQTPSRIHIQNLVSIEWRLPLNY